MNERRGAFEKDQISARTDRGDEHARFDTLGVKDEHCVLD